MVTSLAATFNIIQIPATVIINDKVYKVTTIDQNAFKGNKEITDVIFGSNITTIGKYSFYQCTNLRTIRFGSKVTRIGSNAFAQCPKLKNFTLPASIKHIDAYAFAQCPAVKIIKINGSSLEYIGKKAFAANKTVSHKPTGAASFCWMNKYFVSIHIEISVYSSKKFNGKLQNTLAIF